MYPHDESDDEDNVAIEEYDKDMSAPISKLVQDHLRDSLRLSRTIVSPEGDDDSPRHEPFIIENKTTGGKYRVYPHSKFRMNSTEYSPSQSTPCSRFIYEAENITDPQQPHAVCVIAQYVANDSELENYKTQATKFVALEPHENVVQYIDAILVQHDNQHIFYMVTDSCVLMNRIIKRTKLEGKKFSHQILLEWLSQLASGLAHLHSHGILHGNLDLNSIFYSRESQNMRIGNMQFQQDGNNPNKFVPPSNTQSTGNEFVIINRPTNAQRFETGEGEGVYDAQAEVWAFGILIISIITMKNLPVIVHAANDIDFMDLLFLKISKQYNERLADFIRRAIAQTVSMSKMVDQLKNLKRYHMSSKSKSSTNTSYVDSLQSKSARDILGGIDGLSAKFADNKGDEEIIALTGGDGPAVATSLIVAGRNVASYVAKYKLKPRFSLGLFSYLDKKRRKKITVNIWAVKSEYPDDDDFGELDVNSVLEDDDEYDIRHMRGKIKDYEILGLIGSGAQGKVYRAVHKRSGVIFAIKRIPMVDHRDIQIASKEISRMFELDKVDNIVKIQNWFLYCDEKNGSNDMWYINIVMEFCDGGDLRKVIADHRRKELKFKNSVVRKWLKQITSGLLLIHKKNVIHRDVTPKNIFLTKGSENTTSIDDYDVKVGDLGLSIKIEELTKSIATDGTLRYASPQQRNGKRYSTAADIWGLGCVAMEIITLLEHVDFYNELTKDVEWVRKTLAPFEQFYDEKLIQFVHRTLVIDQKDRATASELLSLLEEEEDNVVSDLENGENDIFPDEEGFPEDLENSSSNKHHSKVLNVGSFDSFVSEMDFEHKLRQEAVEQALSETSSTSSSTVKENHPFPVKVGFEQRLHVLLQKPLLTWTSSDVGLWLMCVDMGRYTENFVAQEMNGAAIKYMKMEHLSMVGVRTLGHQIQIYELIQQLIKYHQ